MSKITINLDDEEIKILSKRAKKNLMTLREQIEDIVRRSCVNYKTPLTEQIAKVDDALIHVFSRQSRGSFERKKKKK